MQYSPIRIVIWATKFAFVLSWKITWALAELADKLLPSKITQTGFWVNSMERARNGKEKMENIFKQ
mgnify:CR=1 FL=1